MRRTINIWAFCDFGRLDANKQTGQPHPERSIIPDVRILNSCGLRSLVYGCLCLPFLGRTFNVLALCDFCRFEAKKQTHRHFGDTASVSGGDYHGSDDVLFSLSDTPFPLSNYRYVCVSVGTGKPSAFAGAKLALSRTIYLLAVLAAYGENRVRL